MANRNDKFSENVPGAWYVDSNCIECGLCEDAVPSVFRRLDAGGYNYVFHQPESVEELGAADEAREACPTEAIGKDGR